MKKLALAMTLVFSAHALAQSRITYLNDSSSTSSTHAQSSTYAQDVPSPKQTVAENPLQPLSKQTVAETTHAQDVPPPKQAVAETNPAPVPGVATVFDNPSAKRLPVDEQRRMEAFKRWERAGVAEALVGSNGSIEYPYGYSRPIISCAPLHVCTIILQSGESITSLSLGDTVRWLASHSVAGDKPVIVVKPTQAAISTNLVVTTDKGRVYYMHLVGDKKEYVPIVTFYDPKSMMQKEQAALEAAQAAKMAEELERIKREQQVVADFKPGFDPVKLDFAYKCKADDEDLLPVRVFASDTHTYIQLSDRLKSKDAPAVFTVRGDQTELVNMRVKGNYYVIDGKPSKFKLLLGVGSDQQAVTCEHK